jgi:hypothetical protein
MLRSVSAILATLLLSSASFAAKPPSSPPPSANPQIAYRMLSGKAVKLIVADENNTNASTLYTGAGSFTFDLGPRAQRQIAIADGTANNVDLKLLTYTTTGSGTFAPSSVVTLTSARRGTAIDFSPDGTRIAYACCSDGNTEKLAVYNLTDGSITYWATDVFFWDIAWFRGGTTLAYATLIPLEVREVTAPEATPQLLYSNGQGELSLDSSRTNPNRLVISYYDTTGAARIGLWEDGSGFLNSDLANSARSWQGTLNCDDTKLAYLGAQNASGSQAFYIRNLNSGVTSQVSKSANILLQMWPSCN